MELNAGPKDARGRTLTEGDEVILAVQGPIYYRVMAIEPNLDTRQPPDMLMVHVGVMIPFLCKRGALNKEFIRVRTQEEAGPMNVQLTSIQMPGESGGKA